MIPQRFNGRLLADDEAFAFIDDNKQIVQRKSDGAFIGIAETTHDAVAFRRWLDQGGIVADAPPIVTKRDPSPIASLLRFLVLKGVVALRDLPPELLAIADAKQDAKLGADTGVTTI